MVVREVDRFARPQRAAAFGAGLAGHVVTLGLRKLLAMGSAVAAFGCLGQALR
jgi:hypothetical protein